MKKQVTLIPGDGIGPEVVESAKIVVDALNIGIEWEYAEAGQAAVEKYGEPVPETTIQSIKKNKIALKGPLTNLVGAGFPSPNVMLRKKLDLYANIRHARYFQGVRSFYPEVDLIIVRENIEDTYGGVEQKVGEDAAVALKFITRKGTERVVRKAFEYAFALGRRKLTVSVKANILKLTDGLFLKTAREIAKEYPEIEFDETIIDALCMKLVQKPEEYDVIVMPNVYGDLIADLAAGLVGGLGLGPGSNYGDEIAVFESVHGSAPKYAGLNKVNPTAMILSSALMLRHLHFKEAAENVENAVGEVIRENRTVTYDLGGSATTSEMAKAIIKKLK